VWEVADTDLFGSLGVSLDRVNGLHTSEYDKKIMESPLSTGLRFFRDTSKLV
jgi:hypothetical protein